MTAKRIVFMGTPAFAVDSLNALVAAGLEIAAVVTAPDKPAGRGRELRFSAVKQRVLELGIPLLQPPNLKAPDFHSALAKVNADLFVVVAFRMLPVVVWCMPPLGTINLHASLLPQYRGAAPINWAIINGDRLTGASTFFIRAEIDTGDVLVQETLDIGPDETAGELHDRLSVMGAQLLARTVKAVLNGTVEARPQVLMEHLDLRPAPKLDAANCRIVWDRSARVVHDQVRGLSPFPGAWTTWTEGERSLHFKVLRTALTSLAFEGTEAGTVTASPDGLLVACADGWLAMLEVQPEGKRRMSGAEFARGLRPNTVARLQ